MKLLLFVLLIGIAAFRISRWIWKRFDPESLLNPLESLASAGLVFTAIWLAIAWALAIPMLMSATTLLAGAVIVAAIAIALKASWLIAPIRVSTAAVIAIIPLVIWAVFLLWRGYILPPLGPDTLTYHMPRALLMSRLGGYARFGLPDTRIDTLAANYELMLATILDFCRNDTITEWLSTWFWALFLVQTGAMCLRWSKNSAATAVTVVIAAAAPVVILQGAAHKNDLMTAAFFLAAFHWTARWRMRGELSAALLAIMAVAMAIGTKAHGFVVAAVLLPFAIRKMPLRRAIALIAFGIAALILLGGEHYVYRGRGGAAGSVTERVRPAPWADFSNIVEVPALMLIAPFTSSDLEVPVPWRGESWMWNRFDVYASNFGWVVSILAVLLPLSIWLWRDDENHQERRVVMLAAFAVFILVLPARFVPRGYVSGFPRYTLFIMPIVVAATVPPLVAWLEQRNRGGRETVGALLTIFVVLHFGQQAWLYVRFDKWAPRMSLLFAMEHPGTRWVPSETFRAAFAVDQVAGPADSIDVHGGFDTWIYPAFGRSLERDIHYIADASEIRPAAKWVIVDRAFNAIWAVPGFTSMGQWRQYLGGGSPTEEDVKVIRDLAQNPDFELVFLNRARAQAVFRRRAH